MRGAKEIYDKIEELCRKKPWGVTEVLLYQAQVVALHWVLEDREDTSVNIEIR